LAFWSEFASAYAAQVHSLCASVTAVYDFDLRATHARTLMPAALASVSFGFVLVRVRVRVRVYLLMAVNPESHCRTSKVATISHGPSVRHSHARWASGEGTDS